MTTRSENLGRAAGREAVGPPTPLVIAHRGASHAHPENTLEAFAGAANFGADWVELDVRRSADGVLIVHHDPEVPDGRAIVATLAPDLPGTVPTLSEALAVCAAHGLGVNIEIKSDPREPGFDPSYAAVDAVVELATAQVPSSPYLITSFDRHALDRVREIAPDQPTGQLLFAITDVDQTIERIVAAGHVAVNPWDPLVSAAFVGAAHAAGLAVYPWTVDDPHRQRELLALDVDGIITNVPDRLRAVLADPR